MTLLSDKTIADLIDNGTVGVAPYTPELLQPASLDVRLDRMFLTFPTDQFELVDPKEDQPGNLETVPAGQGFILEAGEFVLGSTLERVRLPAHIAGRVEGKSSLGRLGLMVHSTAGWIDPGFDGHITLELTNVRAKPTILWPGMRIGQIAFMRLDVPARIPYGTRLAGSHYQSQPRGPQPSRAWQGFKTWPIDEEEVAA